MSMAGQRFLCPVDLALRVSPLDCKSAEPWDRMQSCCNSPMLTSRPLIGICATRSESGKPRRQPRQQSRRTISACGDFTADFLFATRHSYNCNCSSYLTLLTIWHEGLL